MILKDEQGEIEVDGKMLVDLLKNAWMIGCANGAQTLQEILMGSSNNTLTVRAVNESIEDTWEDEAWCENFVKKAIFKFVREGGKD